MSDLKATAGPTSIDIDLDEDLYPKDAIYGAAYVFIDRCYVHLDRVGDRRIRVTLRAKRGGPEVTEALAGELENELLGQAWRLQIAEQNRQLIEGITARAIGGAAGPPGLDELLDMDIGDATAFEDPLGIAMSWEEKYAKKKASPKQDEAHEGGAADAPAAPVASGEGKGA